MSYHFYQHFTADNGNNNKLWLIIKPQTYIQYCYTITSVHAQRKSMNQY